ncbi:MAG TPA: methyltransferase domain-containing protein [Acidimicrobiales bacterium]|nr:methyltransferase domain-containing protein [Acidimicrobiales bacterium]
MDDPGFRKDLYRGTARYYDRFRVPYPSALIDDLLARAEVEGGGRLLDLACGTGQISFALHGSFEEVWAVDQEPDMISVGREKAEEAGVRHIRFLTARAEDVVAPEQSFDLVAIGNGFHRVHRELVARNARRWLRPGRCLALLWSWPPDHGEAPWQQAMSATIDRWKIKVKAHDRIPPDWERVRADRPDGVVLQGAGFQVIGSYQFPIAYQWTPEALVGFVYSTSLLSKEVLADLADEFEEDLRRELTSSDPTGQFFQTIEFAYELARSPV